MKSCMHVLSDCLILVIDSTCLLNICVMGGRARACTGQRPIGSIKAWSEVSVENALMAYLPIDENEILDQRLMIWIPLQCSNRYYNFGIQSSYQSIGKSCGALITSILAICKSHLELQPHWGGESRLGTCQGDYPSLHFRKTVLENVAGDNDRV